MQQARKMHRYTAMRSNHGASFESMKSMITLDVVGNFVPQSLNLTPANKRSKFYNAICSKLVLRPSYFLLHRPCWAMSLDLEGDAS